MAYDMILAEQLRDALGHLAPVVEKRMFGAACFMWDGRMLCGADRPKQGAPRFLFRVGADGEAEALRRPGARVVEMGGRRMAGFVFVEAAACEGAALRNWIDLAAAHVGTLPAKPAAVRRGG